MFIHIIIGIIVSILAVLWGKEFTVIVQWLVQFHNYLLHLLSFVIANGEIGSLVKRTLSLFAVPFIIAIIPTIIIWLITRKKAAYYFGYIFWIFWFILFIALIH